MVSFLVSLLILFLGYAFYGSIVDRIFNPDDRKTPAIEINDGVDCVPMVTWKAFLVQLLNIAGTGPIFGAIMGAQFGPCVFLWIVFGSIFAGAVHDYMVGMISCRNRGDSIAELGGIYMGDTVKWFMRLFSVILLVLTGTVFVTSPAALLAKLSGWSIVGWTVAILFYYILATFLPIDKIIGRLYPVFGAVLIIMALSVIIALFTEGYTIPEIQLVNFNVNPATPIWPFMFITVACGAISGFHATQSPMIAKCITTEKVGRRVFYGAMIGEAIIALVWAAAGVAVYEITDGNTTQALTEALKEMKVSGVVYDISTKLLGNVGYILAVLGVIVCPITSGDTAFRSARLILAESMGWEQKSVKNRILITLPLLLVGAALTTMDFQFLWRYFSWSNQTLAMIALWIATSYLLKTGKGFGKSLITAIPATFMSAVSLTYLLMAPEGFKLSASISYPIGIVFAVACFVFYILLAQPYIKKIEEENGENKKEAEDSDDKSVKSAEETQNETENK